ncbi:MAG TPA: DUF1501 domain-containing protein [Chloroflexota bacterium]|nr:DUF1501 domain-containing protein [Chloroflexota bacterium]
MTGENGTTHRCCDEFDDYIRRLWAERRHSRRSFLTATVGALAAAPIAPHMLLSSRLAERVSAAPASPGPILVVIQLQGGNDGLNTIVPYGSPLYYHDRPTIAVPAKSVLPIDNTVGFNPNLAGLKSLYAQGKVAVMQGVGYTNPNRSHFQGTQIWETADPTLTTATGWLGRFLDAELNGNSNPLSAIAIGPMLPMTLQSARAQVTAIESVNTFRFLVSRTNEGMILQAYERMYGITSEKLPPYMGIVRAAGSDATQGVQDLQGINTHYTPSVAYPKNPLGAELQFVAQLIVANLGTRIFHVTLNGFDDHAAEVFTHAALLKALGDSVAAFHQDLTNHGKADNVLMMTFSEFGRRVKENAGRGTDHGTAAPLFVIGDRVKGGMYGGDPVLSQLDSNGDLVYDIDFRSVYGTVIDGWLGGSSSQVLGGSFERLPFL